MKSLALAVTLLLSTNPGNANDNVQASDFKQAYAAYNEAAQSGDTSSARDHAADAYALGLQIFGESHKNTAALALIYGRLLKGDAAEKMLRHALKLHENIYEDDALELIDPLMDLARTQADFGRLGTARKYYSRALNIAEQQDPANDFIVARLNLEIGQVALSEASSREAIQYLNKAEKAFSGLDDTEIELAQARFWIGKYRLATGKLKTATEKLEASLATFERLAPDSGMTMTNHAFLIRAYEKRGQRDEATKHCLAIGAAKPHDPTQDYKPVFQVRPKYPQSAQINGQEGYVIVSVTVDADGFVQAPTPIEREGSKTFEKAALEAVEQFRYVPRFKDGQPVTTQDVKYRFVFNIAD